MPRRTTAMMAVLAVIIHCVLGCCARCLHAGQHHHHDDACQTSCICCDDHHHCCDDLLLCLQPASNSIDEEPSSEAAPQPDHECLGCGTIKCAFILNESDCDHLAETLLLPVDLCWHNRNDLTISGGPQAHPLQLSERTPSHMTPKLRLHLSLAVLTL